MQIEISKSNRAVRMQKCDGISTASFDVSGWDEVEALQSKVLIVDGVEHAYSGWNSDKCEVYFRTGLKTGTLR